MLLKVSLIIGCEFIENITFEEICPRNVVGLCNKENEEPATVSSPSSGTHSATSKRKCSIAPELHSSREVSETDGNVCGIASKLASESEISFADDDEENMQPDNGILCS